MTSWLNEYLTAGVYLTVAAMATGLLLVLWVTRQQGATGVAKQSRLGTRLCASLVLAMWAAVAIRNEWEQGEPRTILIATGVFTGCVLVFTLWPVCWRKIVTRRRNKFARTCVGKTGKVYQAIAVDTPGSVEIMQGQKRVHLPATSQTGTALPAFCEVVVEEVNEAGVVVVKPAGAAQ